MSKSTTTAGYTPTSWMTQSESDLATARLLHEEKRYDWASYAAAQAAEKALKAMLVAWGADLAPGEQSKPWRTHHHAHLLHIFRKWPQDQMLADALTNLPAHDQNARYPNPADDRPPCHTYDETKSAQNIQWSKAVVDFSKHLLPKIVQAASSLETAARALVPPPNTSTTSTTSSLTASPTLKSTSSTTGPSTKPPSTKSSIKKKRSTRRGRTP